MKEYVVFKLVKEPEDYGVTCAPNCKISLKSKEGPVYYNYFDCVMGTFKNLRVNGDLVLADIQLNEEYKYWPEPSFCVSAQIYSENDKNEISHMEITGVSLESHYIDLNKLSKNLKQ